MPTWATFGARCGFKTDLRFTDKYLQLIFPMYPFILTVNFDLNLELFMTFGEQTVHLGGLG